MTSFSVKRGTRLTILLNHQNSRCKYCDYMISKRPAPYERKATIDHVIPRSFGGTNERSNTVAVCTICNSLKGSMHVDVFLANMHDLKALAKLRAEAELESKSFNEKALKPKYPYYDAVYGWIHGPEDEQ